MDSEGKDSIPDNFLLKVLDGVLESEKIDKIDMETIRQLKNLKKGNDEIIKKLKGIEEKIKRVNEEIYVHTSYHEEFYEAMTQDPMERKVAFLNFVNDNSTPEDIIIEIFKEVIKIKKGNAEDQSEEDDILVRMAKNRKTSVAILEYLYYIANNEECDSNTLQKIKELTENYEKMPYITLNGDQSTSKKINQGLAENYKTPKNTIYKLFFKEEKPPKTEGEIWIRLARNYNTPRITLLALYNEGNKLGRNDITPKTTSILKEKIWLRLARNYSTPEITLLELYWEKSELKEKIWLNMAGNIGLPDVLIGLLLALVRRLSLKISKQSRKKEDIRKVILKNILTNLRGNILKNLPEDNLPEDNLPEDMFKDIPTNLPEDALKNILMKLPEDRLADLTKDILMELPEDRLKDILMELPEDTLKNRLKDILMEPPEDILMELPKDILINLPEGGLKNMLINFLGDRFINLPEDMPEHIREERLKERLKERLIDLPGETLKETLIYLPGEILKEIFKYFLTDILTNLSGDILTDTLANLPKYIPTNLSKDIPTNLSKDILLKLAGNTRLSKQRAEELLKIVLPKNGEMIDEYIEILLKLAGNRGLSKGAAEVLMDLNKKEILEKLDKNKSVSGLIATKVREKLGKLEK